MDQPPVERKTGRPRLATGMDLDELRKRAAKISAEVKARVDFKMKLEYEIYQKIIELAEEHHCPMGVIAYNALCDGLRRYTEFSNARGPDRFVPLTPLRAYSAQLGSLDPNHQRGFPGMERNRIISERLRDVDKFIEKEVNPNDPEYQQSQRVQAVASSMAMPFPSSPPIPPLESEGLAE